MKNLDVIFFASCFAALLWQAPRIITDHLKAPMAGPSLETMIVRESVNQGISPAIGIAQAWQESNMQPLALRLERNGTRSWGLFQVNDVNLRSLRMTNPLDPQQNIIAGVGLLAYWIDRCGGERAGMLAYRMGHCR